MNSVRGVISEPIEGHEEYHIMAIQLGPTEASRYWIYWIPAQYVDAIKETILGNQIMITFDQKIYCFLFYFRPLIFTSS